MIKVIHCADLHLDSPMETHMNATQASERNTELIHSFVRLTEYAIEHDVRAVVIAGDMFDGKRVKKRTVEEVLDAIRRTASVDYLYLAGNHDEVANAFADQDIPNNLKMFGREWRTYEYNEVAISGIEICERNAESLYQDVPHKDGVANIITMHGIAGTGSGEGKIDLNQLKNKGIDYLALGHIHTYSEQALGYNGVCCYAGCLEGRGFDECGAKGFVLLTINEGHIRHEFVPFSRRQLHHILIDISGLTKNSEIAEKMKKAVQEIPAKDMVEFVLTGGVDPTANIAISYLQNVMNGLGFFFSKVKNETHMAIDPEDYKNDISLKGEFIRLVLASDASEEDKATMIRTGMQALTGEEITL